MGKNIKPPLEKETLKDLNVIFHETREKGVEERAAGLNGIMKSRKNYKLQFYSRVITTASASEVIIEDYYTNTKKKMLMFGSNDYLGYASNEFIKKSVIDAVNKLGVGSGGPPLLNGYTSLHQQLEERLASLKKTSGCILFGTGYSANIGLISALMDSNNDQFYFDRLSHASTVDGLKMSVGEKYSFKHNDVKSLELQLQKYGDNAVNKYIGVEGVYSMDGDTARLDEIVKVAKKYNAYTIVDDAHGTLVLGEKGSGTAELYGVENEIDFTLGTFSKSFGVTGGFVTATKELTDYLKYVARSYIFSASLPVTNVAAVLAGLELSEKEPERREQLKANMTYLKEKLRPFGFVTEPEAAIIAIKVPMNMDMGALLYAIHEQGIFLNSIEYPAVKLNEQRIRISLMATHTKAHLDRLVEVIEDCWNRFLVN
jgi:glycine C-acetyltransferase